MDCPYCGQQDIDGVDRCPACGRAKTGPRWWLERFTYWVARKMIAEQTARNAARPRGRAEPRAPETREAEPAAARREQAETAYGHTQGFLLAVRETRSMGAAGFLALGTVQGAEVFLGQPAVAELKNGRRANLTVANVVKDGELQELAVPGEDVGLLFEDPDPGLQPGDHIVSAQERL